MHSLSLCRYRSCGCVVGCFGVYIDDSYNSLCHFRSWCKEKEQSERYGRCLLANLSCNSCEYTHAHATLENTIYPPENVPPYLAVDKFARCASNISASSK